MTITVGPGVSSVGVFRGATAGVAGLLGLVPAPAAGDQAKALLGDGTWGGAGSIGGLLAANNLSDLISASTARTNLGLGTLATQSGTFSGTSSNTNTGDQTSIVGITGTMAQFDTAVTDGNFVYQSTAPTLTGTNISGTAAGLTAGNVTTNANLTGDVTSVGNATTLTNAAVIAKVLTGYSSGAGTVAATDTILQALNKLNGNDALKANIASPTFTGTVTIPTLALTNQTLSQSTFLGGAVTGLKYQSGTTNARSWFSLIPNGSSVLADIAIFQTSDASTNFSCMLLGYEAGSGFWGLNNLSGGSGTLRPIYLNATGAATAATSNIALATNGNSGFGGNTAATAKVHPAAGTAAANTAPEQVNTGARETTARIGVKEYNSNHYVTNWKLLRYPLGGPIFDYFADVTVGGAEADIFTSTLLANTFAINGDKVIASYGGNFVTLGTELTQLKAYFAGTAIWDSTGITMASGTSSWRVLIELIRVSSTVVRYVVSLQTSGASGYVYCTSGEVTGLTLTNTAIVKITGTSSGVGSGSGDIVGKQGSVEYKPAVN